MGGSWSAANMPQLEGKTALVTGANSGIGYATALELGQKGATVIVACRSKERGEAAVAEMKKANPTGKYELRLVDLSDLKDVERFATALKKEGRPLDMLVNNAGIRSKTYQTTADGFELHVGTNHLGHFALTGQLLPLLEKAATPRVVSLGSLMAKKAKRPGLTTGEALTRSTAHMLDVDFVKSAATYNADDCYAESKSANLMFMRELGKRHARICSVAAHPGGSATNILGGDYAWVMWMMQSPAQGALPILRAAADPSMVTGSYLGPKFGLRGKPVTAWFPQLAKDDELCKAYWEASVKATGVKY